MTDPATPFAGSGRAVLQLAASILFYVHSLLCLTFAAFVAGKLGTLGTSGGTGLLDWRDLEGSDEWFVQLSGYLILALYLLFTEVYLYKMHLGL